MTLNSDSNDFEDFFSKRKSFNELTTFLDSLISQQNKFITSSKFQKRLAQTISLNHQKASIEEKIYFSETIIRCWLLTKDKKFLDYLRLMVNEQEANYFMMSNQKDHSFENGKSGFLLLLLSSYSHLKEEWILAFINKIMFSFLECLFPNDKGSLFYISGDRSGIPLCELYEGNSGMAFTFMNLSRFFKNSFLLNVAEKLISYEDTLWNAKTQNWPCLRESSGSLKAYRVHKKQYLSGEHDQYVPLADDLSFKHGAIGIAFTRLIAFKSTGKLKYKVKFEKALHKIECSLKNDDHSLSPYDKKKAEQLLRYETLGFPDLFSEDTHPVGVETMSNVLIIKRLLKFPYLNTLKIAGELNLALIKEFSLVFDEDSFHKKDILKSFYSFVRGFLKKSRTPGTKQLREILQLEYKKIELQKSIKNIALLRIQDGVQTELRAHLLNLNEEELLNRQLILNRNVLLVITNWQWIVDEVELFLNQFNPEDNIHKDPLQYFGLLKAVSQYDSIRKSYILEKPLSEYQYLILDLFEYPVKVSEVLEEFSTLFEIRSDAEFHPVKTLFLKIVRDAIFDKSLIEV